MGIELADRFTPFRGKVRRIFCLSSLLVMRLDVFSTVWLAEVMVGVPDIVIVHQ